jgi:plasmid stabilization system protein ParE
MAQLRWSLRAAQDLEDICDYIARDSETYARLFAQKIIAFIETIPDAPLAGTVVPEYQRVDLRERIFRNYRIVYRTRECSVEIVSIVHGA